MTSLPAFKTETCQIKLAFLPGAKILVEKGKHIKEDQVLIEGSTEIKDINLAQALKISPKALISHLLVVLGSTLEEGQIIAQKSSLLNKIGFKSPVSGKLIEITPEGVLRVQSGSPKTVKSFVNGKVEEIEESTLTLEFSAEMVEASDGTGDDGWGIIEILDKNEEVEIEDLPKVTEEKILFIKGKIPSTFAYKASALGAVGIVGGSMTEEIKSSQLSILILGDEEGLISKQNWDTLKKHQGKRALISGSKKTLTIPL